MLKVTSAPAETPKETIRPRGAIASHHRRDEAVAERVERDSRLKSASSSRDRLGAADEDPLGAVLHDRRDLVRRAGLTPDGGAGGAGERDDHAADTAGGAEHQHAVLAR